MRLVVLVPSRGSVSVENRSMVLRLASRLARAGHSLAVSDDGTPGLLHHSRTLLLETLSREDPKTTRGLWLDADTWLDEKRVLWAMSRPEETIAWGYPVRVPFDTLYPPQTHRKYAADIRIQPFRAWTVMPKLAGCRIARSVDGQLVELFQSGFGAVLMNPRVARDMHDAFGPHQYGHERRPMSGAFDHLPHPAPRCSEDVSFWRRALALGHQLWCDPLPYVTNGQCGGSFAEEIALREAQIPEILRLSQYGYAA